MRKNLFVVLFIFIITALVLSACGTAATPTAAAAAGGVSAATATLAPGSVQVNAGGGTFPLPLYTQWTYTYQYVDPSVAINYQGIGSGGGKSGILDNTLDFAGSDSLWGVIIRLAWIYSSPTIRFHRLCYAVIPRRSHTIVSWPRVEIIYGHHIINNALYWKPRFVPVVFIRIFRYKGI